MFKNSGVINGKASVFVMPVTMPVQMDAIPMSFGDRHLGWGQIAVDMVHDLSAPVDDPVRERNERAGCKRDADVAIRAEEGNPYRWADKDAFWQEGIS